jgi:hypothetical protein
MTQKQTKRSSPRPRYQSDSRTDRLLLDLANMRDEDFGNFRRRWDRLYSRYKNEELLKLRDQLRMLWSKKYAGVHPKCLSEAYENHLHLQISLRAEPLYHGWLSCPDEPLEGFICGHWLSLEKCSWLVMWRPGEKRIKPNPHSLPTVLACACAFHADHLAMCRNVDCPAPYFIASRRDQKFCTDVCALPAKKAAKLRWWHKHRGTKHQDGEGKR